MSANSKPAAAKATNMFIPHPLKAVTIGKTTVKLYPVITLSMQPPERAHAFQVNKTALAVPGIDKCAMLDTLGTQLSLSATVDGTLGDWDRHFNRNWCNFAHLSILSFHNDAGAQVINTATAADAAVLLPVQDGAANNCRRVNIKFVCIQLNLDFITLVTLWPPGPGNTILCAEYYIELPQDSRNMQNGANQEYRLTTYLGPSNLCAIAADAYQRDILAITLQDGPVDLLSPMFNLTLARIDRTALVSKIRTKIIMLATPSVLECLFNQLCPGYYKEPHATLDHIRQTYEDIHFQQRRAIPSFSWSLITIHRSWELLVHSLTKIHSLSASAKSSSMALTLVLSQGFTVTSPIIAYCRLAQPCISAKFWKQ
jgi:hypothetical protein